MTGAWLMAAAGQVTTVKLQTLIESSNVWMSPKIVSDLLPVEDALLPELQSLLDFIPSRIFYNLIRKFKF